MDFFNKKITIKDIAQEAGVSTTTVSRALNGTGRVSADTVTHVLEIVNRMKYRPNMAAQSLKTRKSRNILLVVPDITNPFYSSIARTVQSLVKKEEYALTLYDTNDDLQEETRAIELASEMYISGIVLASIYASSSVLNELRSTNIPAVLLNSYDTCGFDTIHGQRGMSTLLSTRYLLECGHRRLAFAGGVKDSIIGASRKKGYLDALAEKGIYPDGRFIFEMGFSEDSGYKSGKYLTTLNPMPTAICCANDMLAIGVLSALHEENINVPGDISITGMDNIVYSRTSSPPLTTVTNDSTQFAKTAVRMLYERINKKYEGQPREISIDRELIIRGSVGQIRG